MTLLGLALGIAVPLFAGLPWLMLLQPERASGAWAIAIGHGYVAGVLVTAVGMHLLSLAHVPIGLATSAALPLAAGAVGWLRWRRSAASRAAQAFRAAVATWRTLPRLSKIVCVVALALIAIRMGTLATETVLRPIFPWEAVSSVAAKARVWYEAHALVPFVSPTDMLDGRGAYTDADPRSASLPSLVLVWTATALGGWQEGAVGFAWWMLGVALACAFYGHVRATGGGVAFALAFDYVLLSIPLVDLHIALSGSQQWIAAVGIGLAGCAVMRALVAPSRAVVVCAAIGMALALWALPSSWPWLAIFAIAFAIERWPRRGTKIAVLVPLVVGLALLAAMQVPVAVSGLKLQLQVASEWSETPESLLLLDNWHLLYPLLALVVVLRWPILFHPAWRARSWIVAMGLGLMMIKGMLALPPWWFGGLRDFSYTGLQLVAPMLFWIAWIVRATARQPSEASAQQSGDVPVA
jgi:hypothetical protein